MCQLQLLFFSTLHADAEEVYRMTAELGIAVIRTGDSAEAIAAIRQWKFDGMIVDLETPGAEDVIHVASASSSNGRAPALSLAVSTFVRSNRQPRTTLSVNRPITRATMNASMRLFVKLMVEERHRYFRCPVDITVRCTSGGGDHESRIFDLSRGGLAMRDTFARGLLVNLRFTLPEDDRCLSANGQIVWTSANTCAIRFISIGESDRKRLHEWLRRKCELSFGISNAGIPKPDPSLRGVSHESRFSKTLATM